ncbi:MAG: arsenate reductase [Ferruginibacter sp.]
MAANITIYGIPNCDVTKKAITWLQKNKIDFEFHDYKKFGVTVSKLTEWSKKKSWEILLNKRGTTWKKLSPEIQQTIDDEKTAVRLMQEHTSLIKRPVIEVDGKLLVGYDEAIYKDAFVTHHR